MRSRLRSLSYRCVCIALVLAQGDQAWSGEPASQASSDAGDSGLAEIVVTASKREQNLMDVGLSVAALSATDLQNLRVNSGADLARITPGLVFTTTANDVPVYTLRGVGFYEQSLAAYPDVSIYLDQAPLPFPILASLTLFDLERVETLKGPQGTLFGNNSTGGAINYVAAKPTKDFGAGIEVGYSRFNTSEVSGFVSGPLTDSLQGRVAIRAERGDGWQTSVSRNDSIGKKDNGAVRLILDWTPTDTLSFSLNVNGWRNRDDPQSWQISGLDIKNPAGSAGFGGVVPPNAPVLSVPIIPNGNLRLTDWTPQQRPYTDNTFWQTSLHTDFAVTPGILLTGITSYEDFKLDGRQDEDGSPLVLFELNNHEGYINSFSQEIRLSSQGQSRATWVLGANYERDNTGEYYDLETFDSSSAFVNGAALDRNDNYQQMRNYAGFANLEYKILPSITLKGGVRRSQANRDSNAAGYSLPGVPAPAGLPYTYTQFFNLIYGALYPGIVAPLQPGQSFLLDTRLNANGTPVDPATYLKTGRYYGTLNEGSTSWSFGIDFRPTDGLLLYANVSKGYKSGSFPLLAAAIFTGLEPVKQESLLDYETGFKVELFDRMLLLTGAVFYYDYTDKQLLTKFIDPIFGALDKLENVPKSAIRGAELGFTARPVAGLTLSGNVTYLDAKVNEYVGAVGSTVGTAGLQVPILASFSGATLPFSPEWQYSTRADYDFPMSRRLVGFLGLGLNGQSASYASLAATASTKGTSYLASYGLVDANVGVKTRDGRWRFSVWGKNILNKYYVVNRFSPYDTEMRLTGLPAWYGVTAAYNFK
jgi:iron complex outermembrane recepter protein